MKKKTTKKASKNKVVEIHIYVHQSAPNSGTGGNFTVHPNNPHYYVTC